MSEPGGKVATVAPRELRQSFLRVMGALMLFNGATDVAFFLDLPADALGTLLAVQLIVFAPLFPLGLHTLGLVREPDGPLHRRWVLPNALTTGRLFVIPAIVVGLQHVDLPRVRIGVAVLFAAAAVSDLLDGMISRRFRRESELGRVLDPFADTCFYSAVSAGLFAAGVLPGWLLVVALVRFVPSFVVGFTLFLRAGKLDIPPSALGKASSAMIGVTIMAFVLAAVHAPVPPLALTALSVLVTLLCAATAVDYARLAWRRLR